MYQAIGAAILSAGEILFSRKFLGSHEIKGKQFTLALFTFMAILQIPLLFFFWQNPTINSVILTTFITLILIAILYNFLWYTGLENTQAQEAEPILLTHFTFNMLLAYIFFASERNPKTFILGFIATLTIIAINTSKHLTINKSTLMLLFSAFLMAVHAQLLKILLTTFNPVILNFYRALTISIILFIILKPKFTHFKKHSLKHMFYLAILVTIENILFLWSYQSLGIIQSSLILTLTPIVAFWGSSKYLHEKIKIKNIIGTIIILCCITLNFI